MYKAKFKKFTFLILIFVVSFSFTFLPPKPVKAQFAVVDAVGAAWDGIKYAASEARELAIKAYDRGGALAFQQTLRKALNKVAIDSATWIASGDKGQKPLFITEGTGEYFANIADEAAGDFVEGFVNNWAQTRVDDYDDQVAGMEDCSSQLQACESSCRTTGSVTLPGGGLSLEDQGIDISDECINECMQQYNQCIGSVEKQASSTARPVAVCQPSSIDAKLRISMGLVQHTRPRQPTCTASELVRNWSDEISRLNFTTWDDRDYLNRLSGIFRPRQSDIGIALTMQSDLGQAQRDATATADRDWMESGRWLDVVGISGSTESLPGQAEMEAEIGATSRMENLGKYTGDAFVDAANIFINTLAMQYYNRLMQGFGKTVDEAQEEVDLTKPDRDPSVQYSNVKIEEKISQILEPAFSQEADYNITSDLSICPDPENPGPTDCVIDTNFSQAINEKKTVIEAINDGSLRSNWNLTSDNNKGRDNAYTLRNISVLRKHRILPVGWEIAAEMSEDRDATLMDLVSCFDPEDEYQEFSSAFDRRDASWCQGLVDPHWVLKAPLSFCQKQGVGGQILDEQVLDGQSGIPNSPDIPSRLSVTRADDYCADEMTCIKEDPSSGGCLAYGYCNEEKRIWSFEHASCEPEYNTCTAFTDSSGDKVAYLENTLDYSICSEENAGCLEYYLRGAYDTSNNQIDWNTSPSSYFNNDLANCSQENEGCSELMRVKSGWGSNLIMGADFQHDEIGDGVESGKINDYWPIIGGEAEIVDGQDFGLSGAKVMKIEGVGLYSDAQDSLLPENFFLIPGYSYTFSADVYVESGSATLMIGEEGNSSETSGAGSWQRLYQTYHLDPEFPQVNELEFRIDVSDVAYIKNPKLEISSWANDYSPYGSYKIYQKLIPQYLENVCYEDNSSATPDYRLIDDAPSVCYDFARQCNQDEVGCIMLTSEKNNISVPAQPATSDYCPRECEAYDVYVAQASHFYNSHSENLIPYNSQVCSADASGCTEFTNLDDIPSGGERKEHYTHLKHCIKPDDSLCTNFYTWQGDDEDGYQLRAMSLKEEGGHPELTSEDDNCSQEIYNLTPWHPDFNPDCRQFYNQDGQVSYNSVSKTITCSENCHTYRMTDVNFDPNLSQADCTGIEKSWDGDVCRVCKNNGIWSDEHNSCLYQAIPGEGKTCSANMAGCREYSGSDGSNVRLVDAYDFQANIGNWEGYCGHDVSLSNVSVSQNGQSLWYQADSTQICESNEPEIGIGLNLGHNLNQGKSYSIQLLARADEQNASVEFSFENTDDELEPIEFYPDPVQIRADQWQIYELNLPVFNRSVASDETLLINSDNDFYIDNIVINEVSDKYYLISDSSDIPDICYYDIFDEYRGADYNLGCSRWTDQTGVTHFLRKISNLCHESSVGCEMMIDTANNSDWRETSICDVNNDYCADVPGDQFISAIYDRDKVCSSNNKGCIRMGQVDGENIDSVYKKNNPENYSSSLCAEEAVGCREWDSDFGYQYFKDPGNDACVYRQSNDSEVFDKHWFKKSVKRCDLGGDEFGQVCSNDDDCGAGVSCMLDETDYPCSVSYFETIGNGGLAGRVATPDLQAGICESGSSGCTEYIDPVSEFSSNLVLPFNWDGNNQDIRLTPNTLYLFTVNEEGESADINFSRDVREFDFNTNTFSDTVVDKFENVTYGEKVYFHSQLNGADQGDSVTVTGGSDSKVIVRPLVIDYQLKQNVDYSSCDGLVNFNSGCVLFNERAHNGVSGISQLSYDAFASESNRPPVSCAGDNCNANQLIKVSPDRTCARWLDCSTYGVDQDTGEKTCYDLGECTHLNENQECANFMSFQDSSDNPITLNYNQTNIHNLSGYSLLDNYYIGEMKEVGLNSELHFNFEQFSQALHCRRDIETGFSGFPNSSDDECSFNDNIVADSLIIEPKKATTDYPAQGRGYLKVLAYHQMSPHSENNSYSLDEDEDYYLHYLLNTEDSGLNARVLLVNQEDELVWSDTASANNGWERQIHKIDTSQLDEDDNLKLYLSADTNNLDERYVYFDDIHIEPVLQVAPDEYVAKDCRLYPETDSLSCISKNEEIIKHGLEGYCLERDPNNFDNCITWYPVDEISSSQLNSSKKLGYQGPQPLHYCADVNADFEILEKRVANFVGKAYWDSGDGVEDDGQAMPNYHRMSCTDTGYPIEKYGIRLTGRCCESGYEGNKMVETICGGDDNYVAVAGQRDGDHQDKYFFCIPKAPDSWIGENGSIKILGEWKTIEGQEKSNCKIEYRDVWGVYDGLSQINESGDYYRKELESKYFQTQCAYDGYDYSEHEVCRNLNEANNHQPPIAVYDEHNPPLFEEDLKFIAHDNVDKVYELTCNRFVQVVDPTGVNKAWTARVGQSAPPQLTPNFMAKAVIDSGFSSGGEEQVGVCSWKDDHPQSCLADYNCSIPCKDTYSYQGKNYELTQIGNQCWMAENLNVGDMINSSSAQTDNGTIEKYCYNNSSANCSDYGGLYTWNQAMLFEDNEVDICPSGWGLPTNQEVQTMKNYVDSDAPVEGFCDWLDNEPEDCSNYTIETEDEYGDPIYEGCEDDAPLYCEDEGGLNNHCVAVQDIENYCSDKNETGCDSDDYCRWFDVYPNVLKSCRQVDSPLEGDCNTNIHPRWDAIEFSHGVDSYNFSALPAGAYINNDFRKLGESFYFWTSEPVQGGAKNWYMHNDFVSVQDSIKPYDSKRSQALSVRCIRKEDSCVYNEDESQWDPPGCCDWDEEYADLDEEDPVFYNGCVNNYPYCMESELGDDGSYFCHGIDQNYCSSANTASECDSQYCEFEPYLGNSYWVRYGRLREEVPYGGAVLPDNFDFYSSPAIKLKNQYSERNNQEIFAGRPYGCSGESCENIGQCSLNPNVYCIYEPESGKVGHDRINSDSCYKGGYGYCLPLWKGDYEKLSADTGFFDHPLRSIFLKSFGGFEYDHTLGLYESADGYSTDNEDYSLVSDFQTECSGGVRSNPADWCPVYPRIENVRLVSVETGDSFESSGAETNFPVDPGLYYLEFNSIVDLEQQPLNRIEINWGDESSQVIVNQDHRPESNKPHRFFHFYSDLSNIGNDFNITVYDNWGFWDSLQ